ncbi:MAG: AI-2E family transporter [Planctomycetaceae bacterium]|jgi:predicted PurR-regulated permease PerM|nr:AI-2E family transporter [Planctomycetaceae bacterium]
MFNENGSIFNYEAAKPAAGESEKVKNSPPRVTRALAIVASIVIVLAGVKAASGLLGPIMLALFLAIILLIPLRFLERNRCPAFLSYLIVIGGTITLFILLTYFVGKSLNDFIGKIPAYKDRFTEKYTQIEKQFERFGFVIGKLTENLNAENPNAATETLPETNSPETVPGVTIPVIMPEQDNTAALAHEKQEKTQETVNETNKQEENAIKNIAVQEINKPDASNTDEEKQIADKPDDDKPDDDKPVTEEPEEETSENAAAPFFPLTPSIDKNLPTAKPEDVEKWVRNVHDTSPSLIALDPQNVMYWIASIFLQLRHLVEGGFLVLIFTIFMLFEASQFSAKVDKAIGKEGAINNQHLHQIARDIRRYLVLKTIVNFASGGAAMFVYWFFGVPAWFFWGIIAFFLYYIPNIGGTLAAVIPGILIFVNYDLPGVFLYGMCLVVIECTIAYGFEPRFLGHGLGLSTVVILLTLVFWGWILGPIGLFLAAPLTVMLKIILQAFPETKWIAIMLDDRRAVSQQT